MTDNDQQNNEETQEEVYNIVTELRNATGDLPGFAWAVIAAVLLLGVILVVQSNDAFNVSGESEEDAPVAVISPADETEAETEPQRDPDAPISVISPAGETEAETDPERDPDAPIAVISPAETEEVEAEDAAAEEEATEEPAATEEAEAAATEEPEATDAPEPTTTPEPTAAPAEADETASADMEAEVEALRARVQDLEEEIISFQADATTRALQMESLRATVTAATSDE